MTMSLAIPELQLEQMLDMMRQQSRQATRNQFPRRATKLSIRRVIQVVPPRVRGTGILRHLVWVKGALCG